MNNLNTVIMEGRVVKNPCFQNMKNYGPFCTFSIAMERWDEYNGEAKKSTAYAGVEAWGSMARQCADGCKKDDIIRVTGHLKSSHWCDNDGTFHSRLVVVIDQVEFKNKQPVLDYAFDETKRTASPEEIEAVAKEFFPEAEMVAG